MIERNILDGSSKFIVEIFDVQNGCIKSEHIFTLTDIELLCNIIDVDLSVLKSGGTYDLDSLDFEKITHEFKHVFVGENIDSTSMGRLRPWHKLDDLPYKIHTGRELLLMLDGKKPFAFFQEPWPNQSEFEFIPEKYFDPYVISGFLVKKEYIDLENQKFQTRHVLFAVKNEEWRIEAFLLLLQTYKKTGWCEALERIEGTLLGYEDWQNDAFIEKFHSKRSPG